MTDESHVQRQPLSKSDFLYQRSGPWPQPAPDHPMAMAAEVLHLPDSQIDDWDEQVGSHYGWMLVTRFLPVAWNAVWEGGVAEMPDALFAELMTTTIYSKFLRPFVPGDPRFAGVPIDPAREYYTADYTPMQALIPYPGMYVAPTVTLFARAGEDAPFHAVAMTIGHREGSGWVSVLLTPADRHAWALAKYFALQGAAHWVTLGSHPLVHFTYDAMNAVTQSALPKTHAVFQLLHPHLRLELAVNNAVLEGGHSVVSETRGEIYAPFVGNGLNVRVLVVAGYLGYPDMLLGKGPHDPSFPPFRYPRKAPAVPSHYGVYLSAYYDTIRRFVETVVAHVMDPHNPTRTQEMHYLQRWADYIAPWTPGFPKGDELFEWEDGVCNLVTVLTTFIWNVSILHSADHNTFYNLRPERTPFRIRVPPPTGPDAPPFHRRHVLGPWDVFQSGLAFEMFFRPNNIVTLPEVQYAFTTPELVAAARRFREDLRETERGLIGRGVPVERYARLSEIATSIQY